jgi:ferredoxin-NADP reductase
MMRLTVKYWNKVGIMLKWERIGPPAESARCYSVAFEPDNPDTIYIAVVRKDCSKVLMVEQPGIIAA